MYWEIRFAEHIKSWLIIKIWKIQIKCRDFFFLGLLSLSLITWSRVSDVRKTLNTQWPQVTSLMMCTSHASEVVFTTTTRWGNWRTHDLRTCKILSCQVCSGSHLCVSLINIHSRSASYLMRSLLCKITSNWSHNCALSRMRCHKS